MTVRNYRFDKGLNLFRVYKWFNGKIKYFGNYEKEEDAQKRVDELRENNWNGLYTKPKPRVELPFPEDYKLLKQVTIERNVKPKTVETYKQTIRHYTTFHNQSLTGLIELYSIEEENTSWKRSTLKQHLLLYRNYLYSNLMVKTAKIYFSRIQTVLRHLEIQLGYLPPLNDKQGNDLAPITFHDLLTKKELETCYNVANPLMKAIILFESSSGCARRETLNLTIQDYLEANNIVVDNSPVKDLIGKVNPLNVPTFKCLRQKTMKYYFTYCTPQANQTIKGYLLNYRGDLALNDSLFDCNLYYWNTYFNEINEEVGLGKVRKYNKFRSHMLRKYHASTLYNNGMSIDDVDTLQGRGRDSTHQSYFMDNPELLKKKYVEHMNCLLLKV